jgi:hypothetical protein
MLNHNLSVLDLDGSISEYRLRGYAVERRVVDAYGRPLLAGPEWQPLDGDDVLWHLVLRTRVAQWLPPNGLPVAFLTPDTRTAPRSNRAFPFPKTVSSRVLEPCHPERQ